MEGVFRKLSEKHENSVMDTSSAVSVLMPCVFRLASSYLLPVFLLSHDKGRHRPETILDRRQEREKAFNEPKLLLRAVFNF